MLNKDPELKRQRGYTDPKSFVRLDGSEVLHKADWKRRKEELWERAGGRCEYEQPWKVWPWGGPAMERCTAEGWIPAHIEPRHPRRDDRMSNLKLYCFTHDRLTEKKAWRKPRWSRKVEAA
ncbi:MAG TPA: hypothetical protein VFI95_25895 [Terriglobales bacterium]|nr:hypothetical protein [Terriglobales bacterium]